MSLVIKFRKIDFFGRLNRAICLAFTSKNWVATIVMAALAGFATLRAEQVLPIFKGHINDYASALNASQIQTLEDFLFHYEDSTGVQIAVVIEKSTNGYAVFDRAQFIARGWKVGQADQNNGILLYIATVDHKMQTVVARKSQEKLGAARLGQIHEEFLFPYLKNKDYFTGIQQTTMAYIQALNGKFKGNATRKNKNGKGGYLSLIIALIVLIFIAKSGRGGGGGFTKNGRYNSSGLGYLPLFMGGFGGGFGGGGSGGGGFGGGSSSWGGFGGGGGFDGGGAGGSW